MHLRKSKKILIYFFLLLIFGSINNMQLNNLNLKKINNISITGLNQSDSQALLREISNLNLGNILFLDGDVLIKIIGKNSLIQNFSIFKKYPSTLNIEIEKAKFLAKINQNGKTFLIGSNGKLIKSNYIAKDLPYIFGKPEINEFLKFKKIIDQSQLDYNKIKTFYFFQSKRWDIEFKNNIILKLPNEEVNQALNNVNLFLNDNRFRNLKIIDSRVKNQIIIND